METASVSRAENTSNIFNVKATTRSLRVKCKVQMDTIHHPHCKQILNLQAAKLTPQELQNIHNQAATATEMKAFVLTLRLTFLHFYIHLPIGSHDAGGSCRAHCSLPAQHRYTSTEGLDAPGDADCVLRFLGAQEDVQPQMSKRSESMFGPVF